MSEPHPPTDAQAPEHESTGLDITLKQTGPIPLDVQLHCAAGEMLALVGPSGSGKTTILRCVAGLHTPRDGRVKCHGNLWLDTARGIRLTPQARRVGLVFQHYALFPHLRALENVAIVHSSQSATGRRARALELLALVNMHGLEDRYPAQLSGGQRQRVALARALARDPAVLLLDEPFSAVDQLTRRRLRRELAQLRREIRIPMILVTHDLEEAQLLADRMCVLHRGHTLQTGPVNEVMRRPHSAVIARLVDQRNVFRGRVLRHEPSTARTWLEWAGLELECANSVAIAPGTEVDWLIPQSEVVLHRRDRPSRGEHENPIRGTVIDRVILGDDALLSLSVDQCDEPLNFEVSLHVARRNQVEIGESIGVSLRAEGIHLMPAAVLPAGISDPDSPEPDGPDPNSRANCQESAR